ncbi:hypothetical protein Dxin01_01452 [Deinococcus xinjiangensis]|uniref:N-acetyltransferase domain-containing protein n=1 Tax=Deinococcus xinjiangensis TaxID=457454 RepID=A0ABP9VEG8_9DEIO
MIRPRLESDLPDLLDAMWRVHVQDAYPSVWPETPLEFMAPPQTLGAWVAVVQGKAAGQVLLRETGAPLPDWVAATGLQGHEVAVLSRFFLRPEARGQGLAQALFRAAWQGDADLGRRAILDVHQKNLAAIKLYEREGWVRVATLPAPFTDPDGSTPQVHVYTAPQAPPKLS